MLALLILSLFTVLIMSFALGFFLGMKYEEIREKVPPINADLWKKKENEPPADPYAWKKFLKDDPEARKYYSVDSLDRQSGATQIAKGMETTRTGAVATVAQSSVMKTPTPQKIRERREAAALKEYEQFNQENKKESGSYVV